jgi:MerR family transcriptional regulator, light-induced transcriptional regulator
LYRIFYTNQIPAGTIETMKTVSYSLRQMIDMTGLTEFTLRGWEGRYEAFEPQRTETGRRKYSAKDLQKALLLRELLKRDYRIGEIAPLNLHELKRKMSSAQALSTASRPARTEVQQAMKYLALQDWNELEALLVRTVRSLKPIPAILDLIVPLFQQIGLEISEGRLSIAQEHIVSALIKQQLYGLSVSKTKRENLKLVVAAPEGDFHELGILSAHAIANVLKAQSLYLGPNTPKKDLCETATRFAATHILIAATVTKKEGARDDFFSYVHFLDQNLPDDVTFWLAGRASSTIHLRRPCITMGSLTEYHEELKVALSKRGRNV